MSSEPPPAGLRRRKCVSPAALACLLCALLASGRGAVAAELEWLPGAAREVSRTLSASRDVPALEMAYGPRAQASVGAELGLAALRTPRVTLRAGLYGLVALEDHEQDKLFPPHELWRGLVGLNASVALEAWAQRVLGAGAALELTLVAGHESDHATDGPNPYPPLQPEDIPHGGAGNHLAGEAAARVPLGAWSVSGRLAARLYRDSAFEQGLVAGLELAHSRPRGLAPYLALHAEQLAAGAPVRDAQRLRAAAGLRLAGRDGLAAVFAAVQAGNGYGLLVNRRETQLSVGVRIALSGRP